MNNISSLQKFIWIDQQFDLQSPKYNIGGYAIINSYLDINLFQKAIALFSKKHNVFSSVFREESGTPFRFVGDEMQKGIRYFENNNKEELIKLIQKDFKIPFDINKDVRLFNIWLVKINSNTFIWYTKLHHLIADGFSFQLLFNEIGTIYASLKDLESPNLKESDDKCFAEHVQEEEAYYNSDRFTKDKEFWKNKYQSFPKLIFNHSSKTENVLYTKSLNLSSDFYQTLKLHAQQKGVSVFHILLASFSTVLSKFYHTKEINIGTPILNRTSRADRKIFGPFINLLPLRIPISEGTTLLQLIKQIKQDTFSIYRHQKFQQAELMKAISYTGSRLYDFRISYENFDYQKTFSDYEAEIVALSNHSEEDPISVHIMDYNNEGLKFSFDINSSHIPEYIADEFIASLKYVLEHISEFLNKEIEQFSITTEQQKKVINTISQGIVRSDSTKTFPELWNKNVARYASNKAILFKEEQLSYEEANKKVQMITACLQKHKVQKGDRVGVLLERSAHIVPVILGILQAGASYVPIDKSFPHDRVAYIIQDSDVKILLTDEESGVDCQQLMIDRIFDGQASTISKVVSIQAEDEAYIIYTSGSTGKPKGVSIKHESLVDYAITFSNYFELDESDCVIQQSSFVFDTSIEEIFPILAVGGALVISENPKDFHNLMEECSRYKVTLLSTNPYVVQYQNDNYKKYDLSLKTLISGGDTLKKEQINQLVNVVNVYNTYGPTESTVCASYHKVTASDKNIPIGQPIANRQVYILNNDQLVPKGALGEIALGGKGLAKEYINNAKLTESLFINVAGNRVYKTGDLGQWDEQGNLLFHGRKDSQLSLRGYRIEPQEIEKTISTINRTIKNCFVTVREIQNNPTLIAYVAENGTKVKEETLLGALKQKLPNYMIPNHIVVLKELPINTSGKINTKQLPLPLKSSVETDVTLPSSNLEKELAEIWKNLLNVDTVGIHANFFEQGGHSLLANQFIGIIRERRQQDITLKVFYEAPTISEVATTLQNSESYTTSFQLQQAPQQELYPLSFPQERLWFLNELNEKNKAYYVPRAFKMTGDVNVALIEKTFTLLIEKHEILRTQFPVIDGIPYQRIIAPFHFNVPVISLEGLSSEDQEQAIEAFILKEGNLKFDLENEPLLRVTILRKSEQDNILVFCEHHIIHDGWTQGILLREFINTYEKLIENNEYTLLKPDLQFKDFTYWQRSYFTKEVLEKHATFWRQKMLGHKAVLPLPTKGSRPKEITGNGRLLEFTIEDDFAKAIRNFSQENNATLFITMLAAFKTVLSYFSNETDICIGTATANRRLASVSDILGMIINTIAIRTQFSKEDSLFDIFSKVKESCFDTYAYEDTPFDKVVQFIEAERDLSINPIFQYNFSFMNTPSRNLHLPDLDLEILDSHNQTSKFDINVVVVTPLEQNLQEDTDEETVDSIIVEWEYNSDIFTEDLMMLMMKAYTKYLRLIVSKGDLHFNTINPLDDGISIINTPKIKVEEAAQENVLMQFLNQVNLFPDRKALVFEDKVYTYKQLNEISSQFALYLSEEKPVKRNDIIAIYFDRSAWQIISILAVLKLGAAYLPINIQTPEKRKALILKDAKALFSIDSEKRNAFVDKQLNYDASTLKIVESDPEDLVYIIYTSGSTGVSKGVKINHKNLYHSTSARKDIYLKNINFLLLSSISFDSSVAGIFYSLCYGNSLHLTSNLSLKDPDYLADYILREDIASFLSIPSYTELILKALKQYPKFLKEVIVAGEYCSADFINYFFNEEKLLETELYNEYGPSECTVWATYHKYKRGEFKDTIGKAILGVQTYVLDTNNNFLPNGIIGELGISGKTVSSGYLNNDALTSEKFITKTLSDNQQIRIYKTGDLAIKNEDGTISYKGRKDHQVKIRGHRIELEEIEKVISQHPLIERAVVSTYKGKSSEVKLRAFYEASEKIPVTDLREHIGEQLPLYMIPSNFLHLESFKANENGKIDRGVLADLKLSVEDAPTYLQDKKRSKLEQKLLSKWQDLLEINNFDIDDDFFDLGGSSIQAIYGAKLGELEFPVKYYFQYRTIRKIAKQIKVDKSNTNNDLLIPLTTNADSDLNLILIPYAGALEASYYQLLNSIEKSSNYNVYELATFRNYFKNGIWDLQAFLTDFRKEMLGLANSKRFILYGHCAGTALTMLLAQELGNLNKELLGVFIGASLLQTNTNAPLDEHQIKKLLFDINGNMNLLKEKEQQVVIDNFSIDNKIAHQIKSAFVSKQEVVQKLTCPIHCIFGEDDPLTLDYQKEYNNWGLFNSNVLTCDTISGGNHYFVNEKSEITAKLIINKINDWNESNK